MEANTITTKLASTTNAGKSQYESPDLASGQAICTSYFVAEIFGESGAPEFLDVTIGSDEPTATLKLDRVSGGGSGGYGIYETEGGAITGLYISRDALGVSADADPEAFPQELALRLSPSSEESYDEEAEDSAMKEEASGLLAE